MKRKFLIALAIVLAAAGAWVARLAWRAHHNIVTLHVRNMPLAEVLTRLERQTWETIVADSRLDTKITLHVDDMGLNEVLNRIAQQAGGLAMTIHAVHKSSAAMPRLLTALRSGDLTKADGWTNLAPNLQLIEVGAAPGGRKKQPASFEGGSVRSGDNAAIGNASRPPSQNRGAPTFVRSSGRSSDGTVREEIIAPERIVAQTELASRLKTETDPVPNLTNARLIARQAQAKCTTLYALKKSAIGFMGGKMMRTLRKGPSGEQPANGSPETEIQRPSIDEARARASQLSRYQNLTPEQRDQRARERQQQGGQGTKHSIIRRAQP